MKKDDLDLLIIKKRIEEKERYQEERIQLEIPMYDDYTRDLSKQKDVKEPKRVIIIDI